MTAGWFGPLIPELLSIPVDQLSITERGTLLLKPNSPIRLRFAIVLVVY